jgi:hypothetical protein
MLEGTIDYCVDRPILREQVRSKILRLGKIRRPLRRGSVWRLRTNYGGTAFVPRSFAAPSAQVIRTDPPSEQFGGGYPGARLHYFRSLSENQERRLIRVSSHSPRTKEGVNTSQMWKKSAILYLRRKYPW